MANKYKFNPKRIDEFIALIDEGKNLKQACKKLDIHISTYYKTAAIMPEFKERVEETRLQRKDRLDDTAECIIEAALDSGDLEAAKWWISNSNKKRYGAFPTFAESDTKNVNDNQIITPDGLI